VLCHGPARYFVPDCFDRLLEGLETFDEKTSGRCDREFESR